MEEVIGVDIQTDFLKGVKGDKGDKGEKGDKGDRGIQGVANNITIGEVTKGEEANATLTGESPNQILNLILPKGDAGAIGEKGENGESAYQSAIKGGYEGTEEKFYKDLASINALDEILDDINGEVV